MCVLFRKKTGCFLIYDCLKPNLFLNSVPEGDVEQSRAHILSDEPEDIHRANHPCNQHHGKEENIPVIPLLRGFACRGFSYPGSARVWRQTVLLTCGQKGSSLLPCHGAYVVHLPSSHPLGILSFHTITRSR